MQPAAIALNYSVKNTRNNVRQKIIIFDEKSRFNSPVWGLLMLAPIKPVLSTCMVRYNTDLAPFLLLLQFLIALQCAYCKALKNWWFGREQGQFVPWLEISTDVVRERLFYSKHL